MKLVGDGAHRISEENAVVVHAVVVSAEVK